MIPSSAVAKKFSETGLSSGSAHSRTFKFYDRIVEPKVEITLLS
jgi:hypothetical protein